MTLSSTDESVFSALPVVHSMGVMLFDPQWAERVHAATSCELLYIISGEVELHLDGQRFAARPGDVLLVPSKAEHRDVYDIDAGLQVFIVFFDWTAEAAFFFHVSNHVLRTLPAHRKVDVAALVERLRRDTAGDREVDRLLACARLLTLLMLLLREAQPESANDAAAAHGSRRRRALMLAARRYLDQHYTQSITLDDIANALNVSTFYLSHVFSEESEFSLFAYLTTLRMEKARALLLSGAMNVSEVAHAVGYESGNYFSRVFRKHFGHPPSTFRG